MVLLASLGHAAGALLLKHRFARAARRRHRGGTLVAGTIVLLWLLAEPLTAGARLGLALILGGSSIAAEGRLPGRPRPLPVP